MNTNSFVADRLREVCLNGRWVTNTNVKEQITDLSWRQATKKIGSLNTIAELTFHMNYYLGGVLNVLRGGGLEVRDQFSFDLPPIESEKDWNTLVQDFLTNAEAFAVAVEKLSESKLEDVFVDEKYGTYLRNIEAIIEHNYYHFGQISLLKKLILEGKGA